MATADNGTWSISQELQDQPSMEDGGGTWWADPRDPIAALRAGMVNQTMEEINAMKYRYYETDAQIERAKV